LWSICAAASAHDRPQSASSVAATTNVGRIRRPISVLIDAEDSRVQGAINALALELMERWNRERAVVYNTVQCYLEGSLPALQSQLQFAKQRNIHLGVKLVRGAYLNLERRLQQQQGGVASADTVFPHKSLTDANFTVALDDVLFAMSSSGFPTGGTATFRGKNQLSSDSSARDKYEKVSLVIGTHNLMSVLSACQKIRENSLNPEDSRITFAQLKGIIPPIAHESLSWLS
jgi:proline dehydrogenase